MPTLRFSDGMTINTDGPYRIIREKDGLYVTGHGFLCPVNSRQEGEETLKELKATEKESE